MADNGKWFKLWITAPYDPDLANLSLDNFGRWCKFGCYLKAHGTDGTLQITSPAFALQQLFQVQNYDDVMQIIMQFPSCKITVTCVTNATVTWKNWLKYQGDWSNDRVAKFRHAVTAKKRREEKRKDKEENIEKEDKEKEKKPSLRTPASFENFLFELKQNPAYKNIDIDRELQKMDAWLLLPKARGRKKTKAFALNWLNKIDPGTDIKPGMSENMQTLQRVLSRMEEKDAENRSDTTYSEIDGIIPVSKNS